jgi:UDP-2-acetamido-3-amino-2,3-dideoxy-glucuronate N-acetyltransferase
VRDATADIASDVVVPDSASVWGLAQVREGASLGEECVIGRGAYVGTGVRVGDRTKIQNYAQVYEPAVLEDGVFVGPMVVLTNDTYPRAAHRDGTRVAAGDWEPVGVTIRSGASIGARAVCVAPVTIGRWALVAAGAVVVHDVPDHALVMGNPARHVGWVGFTGRRLLQEDAGWRCPDTGARFEEVEGVLREAGAHD